MFRRPDDPEGARLFKGPRDREETVESTAHPPESSDLPPTVASMSPAPAPRPSEPTRPLGGAFPGARGEVETVVGRESSFDGKLRSEHSIRVQGEARGEIESKQAVYIEEGARVNAKIVAAEITIAGQVEGQLFSVGRVEIRPSGQVCGEINAAALVMQEGAFFDGQLKMKNRGRPEEAAPPEREHGPSPPSRRLPGLGSSGPSLRGSLGSD
ncbi:MAG TPA: polymer-forming cytoskeletal protein [Chloroflexota bacterium]|jgi:cytoskeletal protein CcmA (bactofilin family)|nr:polymer-forming cytoskeletal protein [Chloroflexota bacterium]